MSKVAWLPAGKDACALYRMLIPSLHTPNSNFILSDGVMPLWEFVEAGVCVVQRIATRANLEAIRIMHQCGQKVVYDLDDNLWSIPAYNPAKPIYDKLRDGIAECTKEADILTVSTPALRDACRRHLEGFAERRIEVVPNAIDFGLFPHRQTYQRQREMFTVGWGGTATHSEDIKNVFRFVADVVRDNKDIFFETIGTKMPKKLEGHKRTMVRPFVPISEYASRLATWGWDLFIAPLEKNTFNLSKSNIKILEAAAVGSPILVSDVGAYGEFMRLGKGLDYLLCDTEKAWKTKIVELKRNPDLREALVKTMRQVVREHFEARTVAKKWQAVFESL